MKVVVVGQGYVGLPVAMRAVDRGHDVVGIDLDDRRVRSLQDGQTFIDDVSSEQVSEAIATARYCATSDYAHAAGFDVAVITVPTPLREGAPDLGFVESAGASLAKHLRPGALVVLESTTYPGTTEEVLRPILESVSGLVAGAEFGLGYSPERIDPGNPRWNFVNTPKVVAGIDASSRQRVADFYSELVDVVVPVGGTREAELTKLLENTFRHVNIALVNEMAMYARALDVDIWEAIRGASTKPFGFMTFTPGPGVGGHCLPVDPSYLSWRVKRESGQNFRFVELANDVNDHMPEYVVGRIGQVLNDRSRSVRGTKILVVGIAYKKGSGDTREAPSGRVIELLQGMGAELSAVDPFVVDHAWPGGVTRVDAHELLEHDWDMAVVLTDHAGIDYDGLVALGRPIVDTRNLLTGPEVSGL